MTNATASSADSGLFDSTFSIGAVAISAILFLFGLLVAWTGFQESELLVIGTELNIVNGMAGLMLTWFFAVGALFAALYMEPGFDH